MQTEAVLIRDTQYFIDWPLTLAAIGCLALLGLIFWWLFWGAWPNRSAKP